MKSSGYKILNSHTLCRLPCRVTGISDHPDKNCVILTGAGFHVYNIQNLKCVKSWNFDPSVKFTCPAVFDANSGSYFSVRDSRKLLAWNDECPDQHQMQKVSSHEKVFSIGVGKHLKGCVVISTCGKVFLYDAELKKMCKPFCVPEQDFLVLACEFFEAENFSGLLMVVKEISSGDFKMYAFEVSSSVKLLSTHLFDSSSFSSSSSLHDISSISFEPASFRVGIAFSTGFLAFYSLPSIFVRGNFSINLQNVLWSKSLPTSPINHVVYKDYVHLCGGDSLFCGQKKSTFGLQVWDLIYQTVQAQQEVGPEIEANSSASSFPSSPHREARCKKSHSFSKVGIHAVYFS
eukprot:Sdes_comp18414_c0_seq1m8263